MLFLFLSLPGRNGLDVNLVLFYNSRVWTLDPVNNTITFNADRDFPSYGFRLGYGYVESSNGTFLLTEPDGTKRQTSGTVDSSYISWDKTNHILRRKNGEQWFYQASSTPTIFVPKKILDTNGNFISITYHTESNFDSQSINTISDTVGRVVTFNYDANAKLSSISVATPGVTGSRTYATFNWAQAPLSYNFSLTTPDSPAKGANVNLLVGCQYANGTGYTFSYGDWALVSGISRVSANGTVRSYIRYDYPAASAGALADHPGFQHQIVSSDGTAASEASWTDVVTKYGSQVSSIAVTEPAATTSTAQKTTTTNLFTSGWQTGLVSSVVVSSGSTTLRTVTNTWTQDFPNAALAYNPRIATVQSTLNDSGQASSVNISYGTVGNATQFQEFDYTGLLLRTTQTDYVTDANYNSLNILSLPKQTRVYDANNNLVARTDLAYDTTALASVTTAAQHDDTNFGSAFSTRGNLTSVTHYTNAAAASGAIVRQFGYDTLGNMVTAQVDCCQQKQWGFAADNQYAYPETITRGPSGSQLTSSSIYDLATGLVLSATDENQQVTSFTYDNMNRLKSVTRPGNIQSTNVYDDNAALPQVTSTSPIAAGKSAVQLTTSDGLGRVIKRETRDAAGTSYSIVETQYDSLGRLSQASNPHGPSESAIFTQENYDALGRIVKVIPLDGSASANNTQFQYFGNSTTVTDQTGKQRRTFTDAVARLYQVFEPGFDDGAHASGSVTISGFEQKTAVPPTCHLRSCEVFDTGKVSVTVNNGVPVSVDYGEFSSPVSIAGALANAFNADSNSPVSAAVLGSTLTLTSKLAGQIGNGYSLSADSKTTSSNFSKPSFTTSVPSPVLSGGTDGTGTDGHPPSIATPFITFYSYDPSNNLVHITQGAQGRTFVYDSLGRVTSSATPEAGASTSTYTDFGAIATRTDARGVVATY